MTAFLFSFDCPMCDTEFEYGPCATLTQSERSGLPVIPVDMASQICTKCPHCGGVIYTGELEIYAYAEEVD